MKKAIQVLLVLTMTLSICSITFAETVSKNLFINANFSDSADKSWKFESWSNLGKYEFTKDSKGDNIAVITSSKESDARLYQSIVFEKNSMYKFTADIMASDFVSNKTSGANLSILGQTVQSINLYDTKGKWVPTTLYIKTGDSVPGAIKVDIGMGGYASINMGKASFKNLKLSKYSGKISKGDIIVSTDEVFKLNSNIPSAEIPGQTVDGSLVMYLIIGLIIVGLGFGYYFFIVKRKPQESSEETEENEEAEENEETAENEETTDESETHKE